MIGVYSCVESLPGNVDGGGWNLLVKGEQKRPSLCSARFNEGCELYIDDSWIVLFEANAEIGDVIYVVLLNVDETLGKIQIRMFNCRARMRTNCRQLGNPLTLRSTTYLHSKGIPTPRSEGNRVRASQFPNLRS